MNQTTKGQYNEIVLNKSDSYKPGPVRKSARLARCRRRGAESARSSPLFTETHRLALNRKPCWLNQLQLWRFLYYSVKLINAAETNPPPLSYHSNVPGCSNPPDSKFCIWEIGGHCQGWIHFTQRTSEGRQREQCAILKMTLFAAIHKCLPRKSINTPDYCKWVNAW